MPKARALRNPTRQCGVGATRKKKRTRGTRSHWIKESACRWHATTRIVSLTPHIAFKQKVNPAILAKTEERLGHPVPQKYIEDGKDFRKYLAKELTGGIDIEGEKAASKFLVNIGVIFICWPYSWKNPALGDNMAVLDESVIRIVKVDKVNPEKK